MKNETQSALVARDAAIILLLIWAFMQALLMIWAPADTQTTYLLLLFLMDIAVLCGFMDRVNTGTALAATITCGWVAYKLYSFYAVGETVYLTDYFVTVLPLLGSGAAALFSRSMRHVNAENKLLRRQVDEQVLVDDVTELYNLRAMYRDAQMMTGYCVRNHLPISLMIIQMRYESELRGMLSHSRYIQLRKRLAELVMDSVRVEDKVYCIDEHGTMAILLTSNEANSAYVRSRIIAAVTKEDAFDGILERGTHMDLRFACKEYDEHFGKDRRSRKPLRASWRMMCKAKAWVLALAAGLLLLLIPAQARADVTRLLILNDEQTSETSAAATDVLRRFALYSSWTCTFASSEDVPDTDGYTAVIICTDPNRALNASVALAIQESKLPVFVIGAGGLAELTKTQVYEGSLTLRLQTQANAANDMLLSGNSLLLMKKSGESLGGQIFVGAQAFPLCQTAGNITHLAYFDPSQEAQCAFLSTLLQTWLWPYKNSPTAYGQYLVLDRIYPFADPERLLSLVEMLETENVPYVLCVMPIYANADYPAMKRFCEVLRYAQSRGAGIVMHVPQVTLANVTVEDLQENIANAYSAYSRYGVYPLAIEAPDVWLMSEKGQDVLRGWRTVFLFRSDEALFGEKQAENTALRDGHQIVAPAYADTTAFTNAYAQAIYLDPSEDIETLRTQVNRLKNSRTALKKLSDVEGIVYAGDLYVHFYPADGLYVNGQAASLAYQRFNYDEDYVYDRGFVQYMTEQIQASNKLILVFVAVACTIFIVGMIISRRTTRRQLLGNHPHAKDEQEGVNLHDGG